MEIPGLRFPILIGLIGFALCTAASADSDTYTVKEGDTLSKIAKMSFGLPIYRGKNGSPGNLKRLTELNPSIANPDFILPGQKIILVPANTTPDVQTPEATPAAPIVAEATPAPTPEMHSHSTHTMVGVGFSQINYAQTFAPNVNGQSITINAATRVPISEILDFGVAGQMDVLPVSMTPSGSAFRFYRADATIGFRVFDFDHGDWVLTVYPGFYFTTTSASSVADGYSGALGAEITPVLKHSFLSGNALELFVRYGPVLNATNSQLGDRDLSAGLGFDFAPNANERYFSINGQFTSFELVIGGGEVSCNETTLGVGYHF
jgi:hypothetical protein